MGDVRDLLRKCLHDVEEASPIGKGSTVFGSYGIIFCVRSTICGWRFESPNCSILCRSVFLDQESPADALLDFPCFDETRSARPRRSIFAASRPRILSPQDFG